MKERTRALLKAELTEDLVLRLVLYAQRLVRLRYWRGFRGGDILPHGESAESMVSRVIEKLVSGRNQWNPEQVDLTSFLRNNIRREIGHLSKSLENRSLEDVATGEISDSWQNSQELLYEEEFVSRFYALIQDDELLREICERLVSGEKPKVIASEMGLSQSQIYSARKRLRRLLASHLESYSRETNSCRENKIERIINYG